MSTGKKRGRPRKEKLLDDTKQDNFEDTPHGEVHPDPQLEAIEPKKVKSKKKSAGNSLNLTKDCDDVSPEVNLAGSSSFVDSESVGRKRRRKGKASVLGSSFEETDPTEIRSTAKIGSDLTEELDDNSFKTSTPCTKSFRRSRRSILNVNDSVTLPNDNEETQSDQGQRSSAKKPPRKQRKEKEPCLEESNESNVGSRKKRPPKKNTSSETNVPFDESELTDANENAANFLSCCHCGRNDLNSSSIRHHMASKHHRIWSTSCHEGVFSELSTFKMFKSIRCLKCDKLCHTYALFRVHSKWCGREDERTDCPVCGKSVRVMSYDAHINYAHKEKPKVKEKDKKQVDDEAGGEVEISSSTGRTVRRAAAKARSKLLELTNELGSQSSISSSSQPKYICKQNSLPANFMKGLEVEMKKHQKLSCCYQGCPVAHTDVSHLADHILTCTHKPDFTVNVDAFTCLGCGKIFETEQDVVDHIPEHSWNKKGNRESDSDANEFSGSDTTDDGDEDEEENDGEEEEGHDRRRRGREKAQKGLLSAKLFYENYSCSNVFPRWRASQSLYQNLEKGSESQWLPQNLDYSFRVQTGPKDFSPLIRLGIFESYFYKESVNINVGGPIWAMAWCPVSSEEKDSQFLAIYTHPTEDETHSVNETSSQTALIQLWRFYLRDCKTVELEKPEFVCGLLLDCGPIWEMRWCPTGAWGDRAGTPSSSSADLTANQETFRIGLLAVACHSGFVHILSIPSNFSGKEKPVERLFRVTPVATLMRRGKHAFPCLCLDWHWKESCGTIAAGFSDGVVCLWDLNTSSPLQRHVGVNGREMLLPYRILRCHSWPVKSVAFCQFRVNIMVTSSTDRWVKVWDLTEPGCPLSSLYNTLNTVVLWPVTSLDSFICGGDDCYLCEHNSTILCFCANNRIKTRPLTVHNATVWGMSFNCWMSYLVSCDSAGVVIRIPWVSMTQKCVTDVREVLFVVENNNDSFEPFAGEEEPSLQSDQSHNTNRNPDCICGCHAKDATAVNKNSVKNVCRCCQPPRCVTFKDFNSKWKFSDVALYNANQLPADKISDSLSCALHRVAWNTNAGCQNWLAVGGQAGILRIKFVEDNLKFK